MKCQILFSGKNKKNIINLSSAENAQRVVKVNVLGLSILAGTKKSLLSCLFVCVEVLRPSQRNGVMSSAVSLPNHTFTGQA